MCQIQYLAFFIIVYISLSTVQTVGYGTQFVAKTSFIRWWEESSFTSSKTRKKQTGRCLGPTLYQIFLDIAIVLLAMFVF